MNADLVILLTIDSENYLRICTLYADKFEEYVKEDPHVFKFGDIAPDAQEQFRQVFQKYILEELVYVKANPDHIYDYPRFGCSHPYFFCVRVNDTNIEVSSYLDTSELR